MARRRKRAPTNNMTSQAQFKDGGNNVQENQTESGIVRDVIQPSDHPHNEGEHQADAGKFPRYAAGEDGAHAVAFL